MFVEDKNSKPYKEITIRSIVFLKCDYCGVEFERVKKSRERLNSIIAKDSCGSKKCKAQKIVDINVELYGVPHMFQSEEFKEKSKKTCKKKYGHEIYFGTQDFKEKRIDTLVERYGVDSPLKNDSILQKQQASMIENHGVANPAQMDDFVDKIKKTSQERFGTDFPMQSSEIKEAREATCITKYGETSFTKTEDYWERRRQTTLEIRGVEHTSQDDTVRKKYQDTLAQRYQGAANMNDIPGVKEKITKTIFARFGVPSALCLQQNRPYGKKEKDVRDWLNSFGFNFVQDYSLLGGKEIDGFDSNIKIAFEYCGLYWHHEFSKTPRTMNYHYDKFKKCSDQNVQLITIFEDEWLLREKQCKNFIKSILNVNKNRVFGRKCIVKELDKIVFRNFCDEYHIQGSNNLTVVAFGLYYNQDLIGAISLGRHPRKTDLVVMDRLCFKDDYSVLGGSSKLFSSCIDWAKKNDLSYIVSWSDNRWSVGKVYEKIGFKIGKKLRPDYSYVNMDKPNGRISKQSQKKKGVCDKTEREICLEKGLARIWDCGKIKWVYDI